MVRGVWWMVVTVGRKREGREKERERECSVGAGAGAEAGLAEYRRVAGAPFLGERKGGRGK